MSFTYSATGLHYSGDKTVVIVPNEINGSPVRYLQPECFKGTNVEHVILPTSLIEISAEAFKDCEQLQSVLIPQSVTHIGGAAFQGCSRLTNIVIPKSVEDIGSYAFDECTSLKRVHFDGPISYIGAYAFSDTAVEHVVLPNGILQLGNYLFFNCQQLKTVTLSPTVEVIGACAFAGCVSLESVVLPANVKTILDGAFEYCQQLQSVTFESVPRFVHKQAFADCPSIRSVTAPITATQLVELYDDQRHLYENVPQKLIHLTGVNVPFGSLFEHAASITFLLQDGPDYRLQLEPIHDCVDEAFALFAKKQYEAVLELAQYYEQHDILPLVASSYKALGHVPEALQAYRQYSYEATLTNYQYAEIGSLLLSGTTLCATDEELALIGQHYIQSY